MDLDDGCDVILSFQNSGNHLLRCIIEELTQQPTFGVSHNKYNDKTPSFDLTSEIISTVPIAIKAHSLDHIYEGVLDSTALSGRVILLTRNPIDTLYSYGRHVLFPLESAMHGKGVFGHRQLSARTISSWLKNKINLKSRMSWFRSQYSIYLENLEFYSELDSEKMTIRMEDLVSNNQDAFKLIESFYKKDMNLSTQKEILLKGKSALDRKGFSDLPPISIKIKNFLTAAFFCELEKSSVQVKEKMRILYPEIF